MEERTSARSKGTNRVEVPEARGALDRFKFEVANEIGVDLKEGYNGHLYVFPRHHFHCTPKKLNQPLTSGIYNSGFF